MTTATSVAILSQSAIGAPTPMRAWTGEICGQLIACGLLQTQDSGQTTITGTGSTATTSCTQPAGTGVGNATGYILFSFPDTLAKGGITTTALVAAGSGYTSGTQTGLVVTGVTSGATSARATVVVTTGTCANATITTAGSGYIAGEALTMNVAGAGSGAKWMPTVLSSGSPVVFRLDFGAAAAGVTAPQFWITVGSGSNGSGTINGSANTTAMTQVAASYNGAASSATVAYNSYFCWNATYGFAKAISKVGGSPGGAQCAWGGFYLFRSNDTTGAATAAGVMLLTNFYNATGGANSTGAMQCATYGSGVISSIAPTGAPTSASTAGWPAVYAVSNLPFNLTTTLSSGNVTVFPIMYLVGGVFSYSAYVGILSYNDVPVGDSASLTIIGSTALTFLNDQNGAFGAVYLGAQAVAASVCCCSLWQ